MDSVLPGATYGEILTIDMQHILGKHNETEAFEAWRFINEASSYANLDNGVGNIYELIVSMAIKHSGVPELLTPAFSRAREFRYKYIKFRK
tara:strand:+ start:146 stop:418 length:273 start_codon:yes stop_codon:yes gene_type:complete